MTKRVAALSCVKKPHKNQRNWFVNGSQGLVHCDFCHEYRHRRHIGSYGIFSPDGYKIGRASEHLNYNASYAR